jgi:cytochrome c oxidase subunit 2
VGKGWSILFGATMFACGALFVVAPFVGWWMPEGVSTHAWDVDKLFYIILFITGFFFILTEALLVVFMYQYAGRPKGEHTFGHHAFEEKVFWTSWFKQAFRPVSALLHDQHRVELAWTLVPALILLYIAFAQISTWADHKYKSRMPVYEDKPGDNAQKTSYNAPGTPVQIEVSARQFEWRVRYPGYQRMKEWLENRSNPENSKDFRLFAANPHQDDVHLVNEVHVWKNNPVLVQLKTIDVLHSFNLPHMRVKQDAIPGKTIPVWFTPIKANTKYHDKTQRWLDGYNAKTGKFYSETKGSEEALFVWELACAELCGWGHYRMIGRVYVHETREDFMEWLKQASQAEHGRPTNQKIAAR